MTKTTNNDLQKTTQKTKYRASRAPLKPGMNSGTTDEKEQYQINIRIGNTSSLKSKSQRKHRKLVYKTLCI